MVNSFKLIILSFINVDIKIYVREGWVNVEC